MWVSETFLKAHSHLKQSYEQNLYHQNPNSGFLPLWDIVSKLILAWLHLRPGKTSWEWTLLSLSRRPGEGLCLHHHSNITLVSMQHLKVYTEPSNRLSHLFTLEHALSRRLCVFRSLQSTFIWFWYSQNPTGGSQSALSRARTCSEVPHLEPSALQNNTSIWAGQVGGRKITWDTLHLVCFSVQLTLALRIKPTGLLVSVPTACHLLSLCWQI